MNQDQLTRIELQKLLPTLAGDLPHQLVSLAGSLYNQSRSKLPTLRPEEEGARIAVTSQLAVEQLASSLSLPTPNSKQKPLPARAYQRLLSLFRTQVLGVASTPSTPRKRANNEQTTPRSQRSQTQARTRDGSPTPARTPAGGRTPSLVGSKRARSTPGNGAGGADRSVSPSPSPSKRTRGGPKNTDPAGTDIESICNALGLTDESKTAVAHGYQLYNNLVKDRWGLLAGLVFTIAAKAQPDLLRRGSFESRILDQFPSTVDEAKIEEWILWCDRIVVDQTWVRAAVPATILAKSRALSRRDRKYANGIGNMITFAVSFNNQRRIDDYKSWRQSIYDRIKEGVE